MSEQRPGWRALSPGAIAYKSSTEYETGDWGTTSPAIDLARCTKCNLCHFYCPEGAIAIRGDGYPLVDLRFCKGCGICAEECPVKCIRMVRKA